MRAAHRTLPRTIPAVLAVLALALAGLTVAAPAEAAQTTVTLRLVNAAGTGVQGVDISAGKGTKVVGFGVTNSNGVVSNGGLNSSDPLTAGTWTFRFFDFDTTRNNAGNPYSLGEKKFTLQTGANDLGQLTMKQTSGMTARLRGQVSNSPLSYLTFQVVRTDAAGPDQVDYTDQLGNLKVTRLVPGQYRLDIRNRKKWKEVTTFTVDTQGQSVGLGNVATKVPWSTRKATAVSPAKGKVTITYVVDANNYGSPNPQGTVTFTLGKRTATVTTSVANGNKAKASTTFTGVGAGKKACSAAYVGSGDVLDNTAALTCTVK